jgi:phospholipid/cholesterol/gamma-HCH transport system substrate-binding protein
MEEQTLNKTKLGAFVLIAVSSLLLGLYFIGSKKNIFHSTITVSADFNNVGGLMPGNNVRFNGINVGTVSKVYAIADTAITVEFTIDKGLTKYISQNDLASVGTDGLLGNKLINIETSKIGGHAIEDGNSMKVLKPIQMDNVFRTLTVSNENLKVITENLKDVSGKLSGNNSFLNLFKDTAFAQNVKSSVVNLKLMSNQAVLITGNLKGITENIKHGKGTLGALITDTTLSFRINHTIVKFEKLSDTVAIISGDISDIVTKLKQGKGSIGVLLNDTTLVHNLNKSILTIDSGAGNFNQNMKALQYTWPFKKYFRKQKIEKL